MNPVGNESRMIVDVCKASVHMPGIGFGLAGGTWDKIELLVVANISKKEIDVTVFNVV